MAVNKQRFMKQKVSCSCSMPGVWKAVAHSQGCAVIYHAPRACAHITEEMDRSQYFRMLARQEYKHFPYTAPLITSDIGKKESIFGGTERLKACIAHVVDTYHPTYIVVANSCVAGVIGDDTASVCEEAEDRYGIPVLHIDSYGFLDGEYYGGFVATAKQLIDRFVKAVPPNERSQHTVTLIGEKDGPRSLAIQQFCQLIEDFGLQVNTSFPGYCSPEEMAMIGSSAFTFILGGTARSYTYLREIADYMTEQLGIPHFSSDYPIGWEGTKRWLDTFYAFLKEREHTIDLDERASLPSLADVKEHLWQRFITEFASYEKVIKDQSVVVCIGSGGMANNLHWLFEWLALGKMAVQRIILMDTLPEEHREGLMALAQSYYPAVPIEVETSDTQLDTETITITTQELAEPHLRQFILPCLPPIGLPGFLQMYKKIFMLARRKIGRGIVLYGW